MINLLKSHPFGVEAFFVSSTVVTYAAEKSKLEYLIPSHLELDTFNDKWAFIAVALVQTKHLRPKGFPSWIGRNFFLIGYRIFVRYEDLKGRRLRGLYILKSETDKKTMQCFGNLFTHYNYSTTDIAINSDANSASFISNKSRLTIEVDYKEEALLPHNSPFASWKEARRFAGPLPFTFTQSESENKMLIVEGVRSNWKPRAIELTNAKVGFVDNLNIEGITLANAFEISNIPYYWKKGIVEQW